jgi:branched-chain amino acid transport system substrate-binding protein
MPIRKGIDRRIFVKGMGAAAIGGATELGFPAVVQSQTRREEVQIAVVIPMTGPSGSQGVHMLRGWEIAIEEINAQGGIKSLGGALLKTYVGDTQTTPRAGMSEVEKVAQNKTIPVVVGNYNSNVTFPASQVAEQYGLPQLIDMSNQPEIMRRGFKYVFRLIDDADRQGEHHVAFVEDMGQRTGQKAKRAAILAVDDAFGRASVKGIIGALKKTDQQIVEEIYNPVKATNLDVEVAKIRAAKPDVIYMMKYLTDAVLVTRALAAQKVDALGFVATAAGFTDPEYIGLVGDLANFICTNAKFDYDLNRPMEQAFNAKMKAKHGQNASFTSAALYSCAYVIKDALERAGSIDRDKVRDALAKTNITEGPALMMPAKFIRFDERGENPGAMSLQTQCLNLNWRTVWPMEWKRKSDPVWPRPQWASKQ